MKKVYTIFFAVILTAICLAQAPQKMTYQAVIRNSSNVLVTASPVGMRISILRGSPTGASVYQETYNPNPQTNENGLVTLEIGGGIPLTGTFAAIDWSANTYFIKTETDPTGGTNYTITGTSQLLSVPYALYAKTSEKANQLEFEMYKLKHSMIAGEMGTDIDGNIYNTVKIGSQVWMAENLKTTRYRNGDLIGTTNPATYDITGESTPKYQWAYDGNDSNVTIYGRLYTGYAVADSRNVCPTGWHVPTDTEWTTLTDYLTNNGYGWGGSGTLIGKSMAATWGWMSCQYAGTIGNDQAGNNSSGFTALPGGSRNPNGKSYYVGEYGTWWSSTDFSSIAAYHRNMYNEGSSVLRSNMGKENGISVRCLKD